MGVGEDAAAVGEVDPGETGGAAEFIDDFGEELDLDVSEDFVFV